MNIQGEPRIFGVPLPGIKRSGVSSGLECRVPRGRDESGKLRDACLNGEIYDSLKEAQIVIEQGRQQYNQVRPHATSCQKPKIRANSKLQVLR